MIYNSPGKKIRLDWTKVQGPGIQWTKHAIGFDRMVQNWCGDHGTNGRFYKHYASDSYWFENPVDATLFKLRWP